MTAGYEIGQEKNIKKYVVKDGNLSTLYQIQVVWTIKNYNDNKLVQMKYSSKITIWTSPTDTNVATNFIARQLKCNNTRSRPNRHA